MDSKNKNIKDQFNKVDRLIPNELEWENMQAGIFEKMETIDPNAFKPKDDSNRRWIYLGLLALITLIGLPIISSNQSKNKHQEITYAENNSVLNTTDKIKSVTIDQPSVALTNDQEVNHKVKIGHISATIPLIKNETENSVKTNFNEIGPSNLDRIISTNSKVGSELRTTEVQQGVVNTIHAVVDVVKVNEVDDIQQIPQLPLILSNVLYTTQRYIDLPGVDDLSMRTRVQDMSHKLSITTAASIWDMGYGADRPDRADFEKTLVSASVGLKYELPLGKDFSLVSGLIYQRLESRFDWTNDMGTTMVLMEDVVLENRINLLTGFVEEVRGNVEVETQMMRQVKHHNQFSHFQIPLGIAKYFDAKALNFNVSMGGAFNIAGSSSGRLLFQDEIVDMIENRDALFNNNMQLNVFFGAGLGCELTQRWDLGLGFNFQKSITNWSLEEGVDMRPEMVNLELGLIYRLNGGR